MKRLSVSFDSAERAERALKSLRDSGIEYRLDRFEQKPELGSFTDVLPQSTVSSNEVTGSNAGVFPLVGGRAMLRLSHVSGASPVKMELAVDSAQAGDARRKLKNLGGAVGE